MPNTEKYNQILNIFTLKSDERPQLQLPWYQKEFVLASDAYNMVVFDKKLLKQADFTPHEKAPDGLAIIPEVDNINQLIELTKIKKKHKKTERFRK